jgi:hypothetical protein
VLWSTIDFIAATLVGIGPACAPALSRAALAARIAVRSELDNLMITSMLCGGAWRAGRTGHSRVTLMRLA